MDGLIYDVCDLRVGDVVQIVVPKTGHVYNTGEILALGAAPEMLKMYPEALFPQYPEPLERAKRSVWSRWEDVPGTRPTRWVLADDGVGARVLSRKQTPAELTELENWCLKVLGG